MESPKGWVEIWDREATTSRFVDPLTAKSMLVSERFSETPFPVEGDDAVAETESASAPGQPTVTNVVPVPVVTPLPAQVTT